MIVITFNSFACKWKQNPNQTCVKTQWQLSRLQQLPKVRSLKCKLNKETEEEKTHFRSLATAGQTILKKFSDAFAETRFSSHKLLAHLKKTTWNDYIYLQVNWLTYVSEIVILIEFLGFGMRFWMIWIGNEINFLNADFCLNLTKNEVKIHFLKIWLQKFQLVFKCNDGFFRLFILRAKKH